MKEKVRLILKQKGLNFAKLADKMGMSPQSLNSSFKGGMRLTTLYKMAEALEVSAATLLPDDNYPPVANTLNFSVTYKGISVEITQEDILSILKKKIES